MLRGTISGILIPVLKANIEKKTNKIVRASIFINSSFVNISIPYEYVFVNNLVGLGDFRTW